ncbi:MAG: ATP-binding protein, partial [Clostridia bacterium]|nr:ATP-binding protein [Clostridia bacterium]
ENTSVRFVLSQTEKDVEISITNNGRTIPKEKLARIFEQFYRVDSSRSGETGGAGLGLAITKKIVELHHGKITAYSEDETVRFVISLPKECHKIV